MPRPKYKSYYTIEIKKESIETVPGNLVEADTEEGLKFTAGPDKKETVTRVIYTQTVENLNLKKVIEAVNQTRS